MANPDDPRDARSIELAAEVHGIPEDVWPRSPPAPGSSWLHPTEVDSRQIPSHSNGSRDAQPGRITAWEPPRRLVQDRRDFRDCHARAVGAFGQTGGAHDQGFAALTSALGLATAAEGAELATGAASRRPSPARSTACARALAPRRASAHRRAGRRLCGAVGLRRGALGRSAGLPFGEARRPSRRASNRAGRRGCASTS